MATNTNNMSSEEFDKELDRLEAIGGGGFCSVGTEKQTMLEGMFSKFLLKAPKDARKSIWADLRRGRSADPDLDVIVKGLAEERMKS